MQSANTWQTQLDLQRPAFTLKLKSSFCLGHVARMWVPKARDPAMLVLLWCPSTRAPIVLVLLWGPYKGPSPQPLRIQIAKSRYSIFILGILYILGCEGLCRGRNSCNGRPLSSAPCFHLGTHRRPVTEPLKTDRGLGLSGCTFCELQARLR